MITGLFEVTRNSKFQFLSRPSQAKFQDLGLVCVEITRQRIFNPYDKILVRVERDGIWLPSFFSAYVNNHGRLMVLAVDGGLYDRCVAYEDYPYLAYDNDEPEEFYRERLMQNAPILHEKIKEALDSIGE